MKILKKLLVFLFFLTCFVGIIGCAITIVFFDEVNTIIKTNTLVKKTDSVGGVYQTTVHGDYYMDSFIELNGARNYDDLAKFISISITNGITPLFNVEAQIANSSAQAFTFNETNNEATKNFMAKNYNANNSSLMIVNTNPTSASKYASTSIVDLTFLSQNAKFSLNGYNNLTAMAATYFPMDGINEKGLAASVLFTVKDKDDKAKTENTTKVNVTETVMLRMILDNARNVEDALKLIEKYDVFSSANNYFSFFIADASGKSVIVNAESDGTNVELVTYANDNNDGSEDSIFVNGLTNEVNNNFQYITNFILNGGYYSTTDGLNIKDYTLIEDTINEDGTNIDGDFTLVKARELLAKFKTDDNKQLYSVIYNLTDCSAQFYFNSDFTYKDSNNFKFA